MGSLKMTLKVWAATLLAWNTSANASKAFYNADFCDPSVLRVSTLFRSGQPRYGLRSEIGADFTNFGKKHMELDAETTAKFGIDGFGQGDQYSVDTLQGWETKNHRTRSYRVGRGVCAPCTPLFRQCLSGLTCQNIGENNYFKHVWKRYLTPIWADDSRLDTACVPQERGGRILRGAFLAAEALRN